MRWRVLRGCSACTPEGGVRVERVYGTQSRRLYRPWGHVMHGESGEYVRAHTGKGSSMSGVDKTRTKRSLRANAS